MLRSPRGEAGTIDAPRHYMLDSETANSLIKPRMAVVCSNNGQFAVVDHLEDMPEVRDWTWQGGDAP